MVFSEENEIGVKIPKEKFTVLLAVSIIGKKLNPLVIGKFKKPRCFKDNERVISNLNLTYVNSKRTWMTYLIFSDWCKDLNSKMKASRRKYF